MSDFVTVANRIKVGVTLAIFALMVYALWVSREHITHVADFIGVPEGQAGSAFLLVDMPALIGKLLQLKYFAHSTRKTGREMTYVSGSISLVCNVASGLLVGSWGAAGWGAFIVAMFLYLESKIAKIKPAAAVTRAKNAASETKTQPTARQVAARKAAATRKRNATAPTSPGMPPVSAPSVQQVQAAAV